MEIDFEPLLHALQTNAGTLHAFPDDALDRLTDPQFEACAAAIRAWREGDTAWVERQAEHCASISRKLALLNLVLDHAMRDDYAYAAGATSGGEGVARMAEINKPGHNLEADRLRRLIRNAIIGSRAPRHGRPESPPQAH